MQHPVVIMVAGPNGAGKSSIAPGLLANALGVLEYVNADVIARGISGFNAEAAAVAAGRIMLARMDELANQRTSFAFEATGASRTFAQRIAALQNSGYQFLLFYIWVNSSDICVSRVAKRVQLGGHAIPEETIRRRYTRGLLNFLNLYRPAAEKWQFYDNSSAGNAILIAEGTYGDRDVIHGETQWLRIQEMTLTAQGNMKKNPAEIFSDGVTVPAAIKESMRRVRILHKKMGVPLVGSIDGKLVSIPPEEIEIDPPGEIARE